MKFRAFAHNYRMIVKPEDLVRDQYGRVIQGIPGEVAQFRGFHWDSVAAQAQFGWTDDQRLAMERFVMANWAFRNLQILDGGGTEDRPIGNIGMFQVDLAPGETLPKEHEEFAATLPTFQAQVKAPSKDSSKCIARIETAEGVQLCPRDAEEGSPYCPIHTPDMESVVV